MRSGPGEARTILLLHIISVRPSKQPLMVRTFLKVYMELGSYFLFLQEQTKDIIISALESQEELLMSRGIKGHQGVNPRAPHLSKGFYIHFLLTDSDLPKTGN